MSGSASKSRLHSPNQEAHDVYPDVESVPTLDSNSVAEDSPLQLQQVEVLSSVDRGSAPDLYRSAPVDNLVQSLNGIAEDLEATISDVPAQLNRPLRLWCELHGFDSTRDDIGAALARQVVFYLWLKATLYEWCSRYDGLVEFPGDPRAGFREARRETECAAFDECVLDEIAWLGDEETLISVFEQRGELLTSTQPAEDIGRVYEELVPKGFRQSLGQFRTPTEIGGLMQSWAASGNDTILDPGMGAGVLSSPFHPRWVVCSDPGHVTGIDRSPLSTLMGTVALTLYGQRHDVEVTDFLELTPGDLHHPVDAVVSNPPYTSGDNLPTDYKDRMIPRLERETGIEISGRSALYAYFLYHSRSFLSDGDRAAFLTPQNFLGNGYGVSLKEFLLTEFSIEALVQFPTDGESLFDDADVTALLSLLEVAGGDDATGLTRFIRVDEHVDASTLRKAIDRGEGGETDWGFINCVKQEDLGASENWSALFDPCRIDTSDLPPLGDFVTIQRGKSTGHVDFFCLTQDEVDAYGLPDRHLARLIRRPKLVNGYDFREEDWESLRDEGEEVWLLDPDLPSVPCSISEVDEQVVNGTLREAGTGCEGVSPVVAYLRNGVSDEDLIGINALEVRPVWYRPRRQDPPRVLVQDAGRDGFAFVLNETEARNIHNFRGIYDVRVDETELKALLAFLNSGIGQDIIRNYTQTQQGGFEKLRVTDLKALPVIDPTELNQAVVEDLAGMFDELRGCVRRGGDDDSIVEKIDCIISELLGT